MSRWDWPMRRPGEGRVNFLAAIVLLGMGIWVMTMSMGIFVEVVDNSNNQQYPDSPPKSQFWWILTSCLVGSTMICGALTLIVQVGMTL